MAIVFLDMGLLATDFTGMFAICDLLGDVGAVIERLGEEGQDLSQYTIQFD